jgi:PEP-CTERM motif-containing protein
MMEGKLKFGNNILARSNRSLGWMVKSIATIAVFSVATAVTAKAGIITNATIVGAGGTTASCAAGVVGTFEWSTTGAYLNTPTNSTTGCFAGGNNGSPAFTPLINTEATFVGGFTTEGTSAGLAALATGWYALNNGSLCGGAGQCTNSTGSDNGQNSGMLSLMVNRTNAAVVFQIYNSGGTVNSITNVPPAAALGCTADVAAKTFTVAANTICIQDLTQSGSISVTFNAPASVPEPTTSALMGLGLVAFGLLTQRKICRG